MERTISIERLYFLGNFKNIKISNTLTDIPEELAMNVEVMELLYRQQLIAVEKAYRDYHEIVKNLPENETETLEYLDAERIQNFKDLQEAINEVYTPPAGVVNSGWDEITKQ
jgi:hypothetical protein